MPDETRPCASRIYYYFYERTKGIIASRGTGKGLSTLESMLAGLIAGSATTILSNPIWVVQTSQATHTMNVSAQPSTTSPPSSSPSTSPQLPPSGNLSFLETARLIVRKGGFRAFWRGIGPALFLVVNPVLQYTVFEQLKNLLVRRRTAKLRAAGAAISVVAVLSDVDYFFLGALSKLGESRAC